MFGGFFFATFMLEGHRIFHSSLVQVIMIMLAFCYYSKMLERREYILDKVKLKVA